jgi:hypothetical protein
MRRYLTPILVAIIAITGAVVAGSAVGRALRPMADNAAKATTNLRIPSPLYIEDRELDLGDIAETVEYRCTLNIRNSSDQSVTISRFANTCNCLSITPNQNVVVPPGESLPLELVIRATLDPAELSGTPVQTSIQLAAVYDSQGKQGQAEWDIRYKIIPTIRLDPVRVQFAQHSIQAGGLIRRATVHLSAGVNSVEAVPHPEWKVDLIAAGASSPLAVQLVALARNPKTPRVIDDTILLTPVTEDGRRLPPKPLRITGELCPDVVSTPRMLHFGRIAVGERVTDNLRFSSLTGSDYTLDVQSAPVGWTVVRATNDPQVYCMR